MKGEPMFNLEKVIVLRDLEDAALYFSKEIKSVRGQIGLVCGFAAIGMTAMHGILAIQDKEIKELRKEVEELKKEKENEYV